LAEVAARGHACSGAVNQRGKENRARCVCDFEDVLQAIPSSDIELEFTHDRQSGSQVGRGKDRSRRPIRGVLVWAGGPRMEAATMDGHNRKLLVNNSIAIFDITLDSDNRKVYFCDSSKNTIEVIGYDGSGHEVLLNTSLENPTALTILGDNLYWVDTTFEKGSVLVLVEGGNDTFRSSESR
jgi:hypothetical protein